MNRVVRAEVRKVWTTKLWWGMLIGSAAFAAIGVISQIASNGIGGSSVCWQSRSAPLQVHRRQREGLGRWLRTTTG